MKPLKMIIIGAMLTAAMSVSAFAASSGGATVNASGLNLRAEATTASSSLTVAKRNSAVIVLEKTSSQWYKVYCNGQTGYMHTSYLKTVEALDGAFGAGTVKGTSVRMRSGAGTSSSILGTYNTGAALTVTGVSGAWYKVTLDGKTGYIHSDYVTLGTSAAATETASLSGTGTIKGTGVRMRSGASTSSSILGTYNTGTSMTVTGTSGDWYKVSYSGKTGYVYRDYIVLSGTSSSGATSVTGQTIVDAAMKYLGVSYVYGGASPSGFDCSGLTYYIYKQNGYSINRTASAQLSNGVSVEKSNLQPGDLVFFSNGSGGSIGHVGIYIGDNQFIHSSSGGGSVIISDLGSTYYLKYYAAARRIV